MFIVRVVPIAKGIFKDHLTFFSREALSAGSVIHATVRGRRIPAIVISSRDVREEKQDIRSAAFALKKIKAGQSAKKIFRKSFMRAISDTALWHGAHEGAVASVLTSSVILSSLSHVEEYTPENALEEDEGVKADLVVLQAEIAERLRMYRKLAREEFARDASVVIMTPTVVEAERLLTELSRGIPDRVVLFTGELSKKKAVRAWNQVVTTREPVLIIGTPLVLSLPRKDVDTIIVERESARGYRLLQRPYLDVRKAAEALSRHTGARLVLADFPLRVETRYRVDVHEAEELSKSQIRPSDSARVLVVDTRKKDEEKRGKRVFTTVTPETKERIRAEIKKGGRVLVFAARRGIAPLTVCNDCGTPVLDPATGVPMSLHKTSEGNVFLSHRSGAMLPAGTTCKNCGGWNLATLGIGIDRVHDELAREFPDVPLYLFTKESAPTHARAKKIAEKFYAEKGCIVVGTERMLPYIGEPVELSVVASMDSILSLPAWRAHEHALSILYYLKERTQDTCIIETRKPDNEVMKTISGGNPADFYRTDIAERERYSYPPFAVFIGLTAFGTPAVVEKSRLLLEETFKDLDLVGPMPAEAGIKNQWTAKAVIRLPRGGWPNATLSERLRDLPPNILVSIDPDEIV